LVYRATLSLDGGLHFLTCVTDSNWPPRTADALRVVRTAPPPAQVTISINPFVGVCKEGESNATIRVMGASSATANLTLRRVSGNMGEARFVDNNMTTLNNVTISSAGTQIRIRGITESDSVDNIELTATLTSGGQAQPERFSVIAAEVVEVDVCADVIRTEVHPSGVNGTFTLRITRPSNQQPVVLVNQMMRTGGNRFEDAIGIDNANTFPAGTYQAVEVSWTVGGVECRKQHTQFPMPFTVLGDDWLITCYRRALESDWPDQQVNVCTARPDPCRYVARSFRQGFLDDVMLQGSGRALDGTIIQPDSICVNPPVGCPPYIYRRRAVVFRYPSNGATSCGALPEVGVTVARMCQNQNLRCRDQVCIRGVSESPHRVEDDGCNNRQEQLDRFGGEGAQACAGWRNPTARVIRLGR
jgi:hypothetical protein